MKFLVLFLVAASLVGFSSQSSSNRITTNVYPCPNSGLSRMAHSWSCSKYVQCVNGYAIERDCAPGLFFVAELPHEECMTPGPVWQNCVVEESPCPRWTDPEDVIYLTSNHGPVYFMCLDGEPVGMMCAINYFFDRMERRCDADHAVVHVSGCSI